MDRHIAALKKLAEGTIIPAMPLALDSSRKLDERRQRALIRYYLDAGAGGIAVGVHTTQFEIRRPDIGLFEPVLKIASEEIDAFEKRSGRSVVKIAGACGPASQAVAEAETAACLGYDAVLLSPGGLAACTEAEMLDRTERVAAVLPVIGFYLQTSVGGRLFTYDHWRRLCEIDNVVAIKSAPFNRYQTLDVVRAAALSSRADRITLYTGNDDNIVIDLLTQYTFNEGGKIRTAGFAGGLLGHWAVWTHTVSQYFEEIKRAKSLPAIPSRLLALANEITDVNSALFDTANNFAGCIAGIHEVLRRQGLLEGIWCLNEDETLSPGQYEEIDRVYRMYPHLNDDAFIRANLGKWL